MTTQLHIETVVDHGIDEKLQYFAGYSFGWPGCLGNTDRWTHGVITGPRWADRVAREVEDWRPVIIDNGAYPAFRDGTDLPFDDQMHAVKSAIETIGSERIRFAIVPDVVADPKETASRRFQTMLDIIAGSTLPPHKWMIPVQEGSNIASACYQATALGCAVFVGGDTRRWKFETARRIRRAAPDAHLHIGRISDPAHLRAACQIGVDSFDTTTFVRQQRHNQANDYTERLRRYVDFRPLSPGEIARIGYYN